MTQLNAGIECTTPADRPPVHNAIREIPTWEILARRSEYRRSPLARARRVSVRTLDRYFQRHYRLTLSRWLNDLQLNDAYQALLTGIPVKQVSYDSGYKQPSHFSRQFKQRFGISPGLLAGKADRRELIVTLEAVPDCVFDSFDADAAVR